MRDRQSPGYQNDPNPSIQLHPLSIRTRARCQLVCFPRSSASGWLVRVLNIEPCALGEYHVRPVWHVGYRSERPIMTEIIITKSLHAITKPRSLS
jgi:hypothetical protein